MENLRTLRLLLLIKYFKHFLFCLLIIFSFTKSLAQGGLVRSYMPSNPVVGDTIDVIIESFFSMSAPNGQTCGRYLFHNDTLAGNNIELDFYYELIPLSLNVVQCSRYDTLSFVAGLAGSFDLIGYWNLQGVSSLGPFNSPRNNSDTIPIIISPLTSLQENKVEPIILYPNPADNEFKIIGNIKSKTKSIIIYETSGRLIKNVQINNDRVLIDDLENGVYIVEVIIDKERKIFKMVKN